DWKFDVISLGVPARVGAKGIIDEPGNLSDGWVGFDFEKHFQRPIRIVNDAAMQALGAYDGGRMLFLGFGTGLGSALVAERVVVPLELGALHNISGKDREEIGVRLGKKGFERIGESAWKLLVVDAIGMLKNAFQADYVVIGGGHSELIDPLPEGVRRGGNDDAFTGGFRLWEEQVEPHDAPPSSAFRVVR
ncbi:MAG: ROK family protein, partial [Phycisphaerae bacterium]|nr:ROK family protein [Phycisphaerae bacterium]